MPNLRRHAKRKYMRSTKLFSSSPNYPKHEFKFASLPREKSAPFSYLRLFLEQLRQQTRHIIPRAGWRGIFFIALCTHLPENSFAVAKMERRPLFSTRTQFLTRKKHYYSTLLVRYFCTRRISPPNAKPCLSKISI